jgi:hypothetical protein
VLFVEESPVLKRARAHILSPASGGTTVTITGTNLAVASAVLFGNVPASYTIVPPTEIIATSPAESAGTVAFQVKVGTVVEPSHADFTYS